MCIAMLSPIAVSDESVLIENNFCLIFERGQTLHSYHIDNVLYLYYDVIGFIFNV